MSIKTWLSVVTLGLVALIMYLSRHELVRAWELLAMVNIWVLLLTSVGMFVSLYAAGQMVFSYLKRKGYLRTVSPMTLMRMSLEMNFVSHVLPSGGLSGISYMGWRLAKLEVPTGKSTMAQVVKVFAQFAAFITLLIVAVVMVTIDGSVNRWLILLSSMLTGGMIAATIGGVYMIRNRTRTETISRVVVDFVNSTFRRITRGRKRAVLDYAVVQRSLIDMHEDYIALEQDISVMKWPYIWGLIFTIADVSIFWITFWALGTPANPAPILIAYGVATIAGFLVATPGGAGAYEALMVGVLQLAGIPGSQAIAGILLARMIILIITIFGGYVFYQHAILRYGKRNNEQQSPDL